MLFRSPFAFAEGVQSKPIWTENGSIHFNEELFLSSTGVIFTLFLGLLALKIWQTEENKTKKILAVAAICFVSTVGDWMFFAVLWVLGFGIYHGNFKKQLLFYYMVACAEFLFIIAFSGSTPMQGPHALSSILAPASIIVARAPFSASILSTCFEPGAIESETSG